MKFNVNSPKLSNVPLIITGKAHKRALSWDFRAELLQKVQLSLTFFVNTFWLFWMCLYHTDLRMEAKGVTPIPAPTNITTS